MQNAMSIAARVQSEPDRGISGSAPDAEWTLVDAAGAARPQRQWEEGRGGRVLILGNYRPALTAARTLAKLGYSITVTANEAQPFAELSRYVSDVWHAPEPGDKRFAEALVSFVDAHDDLVAIVPVSEAMLDLLAAHWETLRRRNVRLAMPPPPVVRQCHDKTGMLNIASIAGLDCPPYAVASGAYELAATAEAVGFPLVIRPLVPGSRFGKLKAITVHSHDELAAQPAGTFDTIGPMLLQRYFSGRRYNVYFAAFEGRICDELHARIFRSDRADGSGLTVEGETVDDVPELSEDVHRLARALGYTGVGCAQFLFDEKNRTRCFLEINPRFGANYSFVEAAGMPLTALAMSLAGSGPVPPQMPATKRPRRHMHFVWTYGDLAGLLHAIIHRDVSLSEALKWFGQAIRAAVSAEMHVTWAKDDPGPTLMTYGGRLGRWIRRK